MPPKSFALADAYEVAEPQDVRYTYWPVNYYLGDPHVISAAPLPLSGVQFSQLPKGVGELRASLQLADEDVRAMNPWDKIVPRKTGIIAVRSVRDPIGSDSHSIAWGGMVWAAPVNPETGRMEITARTIEFNWARRLITGPMTGGDLVWAQQDRTTIVQDLLTSYRFSQVGPLTYFATATGAGTSATADYLVASDADAADMPIGAAAQLYTSAGVLKEETFFRITAKPSAFGFTNITFTPNAQTFTVSGDVLIALNDFPGWVTVDKPTVMTGKLHDFKYTRDQQTNLLEAHQARSKVGDGYDWYTTIRVLSGSDAYNADAYRHQYVMGYPRLGRQYGVNDIPRFSAYADGRGNVLNAEITYDGSGVNNVMWGAGNGYDSSTLRALSTNSSDWAYGFLMTEGRYSNPDVSLADTLQQYTTAALVQSYANERFLKAVTVRGDLPPYFGTYALYDDCLYTTDDWTNPTRPDGSRDVTWRGRVMGWVVTPPEGTNSETVALVLATDMEGTEDG